MYDMSRELLDFYNTHVRLGGDRRGELADVRDLNLDRLRGGLADLSAEAGKTYKGPSSWKNQGGYAMHTLNQAANNDYDIDVAIIFDKADLPDDPLRARQRVRDALLKRCTNFTKEPEARHNAVTVWYQDGYHIDFAVYRTWEEFNGFQMVRKTEHASSTWKERDPMQVCDWFSKAVTDKSPKPEPLGGRTPTVALQQMRRIVRFVKWFCRSRTSYDLPGGMIVSTLISECYVSDDYRDDVALYKTLEALKTRLSYRTTVTNPVDSTDLTGKPEHHSQVKRLKKELSKHFPRLAILNSSTCTKEQARSAWDWIFNHSFWHVQTVAEVQKSVADMLSRKTSALGTQYTLGVRCGLTHRDGGISYAWYKSNGASLPKGIGLRFSVQSTNVLGPYETQWTVENEGDEASEAGQSTWTRTEEICETSTAYTGKQTMTCTLVKAGKPVASAKLVVNIR